MVMDRLPGSCGSNYVAIQGCSPIIHTAKPQDSAAIGLRRCDLQHETSGRGAGYVAPTVGGGVVAPDDLRKGYRYSRTITSRVLDFLLSTLHTHNIPPCSLHISPSHRQPS